MKTLIVKLIKFAIFLILFCIGALFVFGDLLPAKVLKNFTYPLGATGFLNSRIKEVKKIKDVDIVIMGSSLAYRGFDPRIFKEHGIVAFNLGSSGQSPIQSELLLNRYLDNINPDVILFEVIPSLFMSDGVGSALDIIANDRNDFYSIKMAYTINHLKVNITLLYGFYSDIFNRSEKYNEPISKGNDLYIHGGYVQKDISYSSRSFLQQNQDFEFTNYQLKSFENIINTVEEKGIRLIIMQAPVPKKFYNSVIKRQVFEQKMQELGEYYNFNYMNLDDILHYYDHGHLNQVGVELFNRELINRLFN